MSTKINIKELVGLNENNEEIIIIQFLTQEELNEYKPKAIEQYQNLTFIEREKEVEIPEVQNPARVLTKEDWLNLEQSLYQHSGILTKAVNSSGNGFSFLLKVLTDGKTTGASEEAFQLAMNMLLPSMTNPLTEEEITYINQQLENNGFKTRL